jgi:AraC-like DNA-binding protein
MQLTEQISGFRVDDCVYPKGGTLGPRVQSALQLFYVYSGHCHVTVDGIEKHVGSNEILLLLPDHVEQFRFARTEKTHHGFCSAHRVRLSEKQREDLQRLTAAVFPMSGPERSERGSENAGKRPQGVAKIRELTEWGKSLNARTDAAARNLYNQIAAVLFAEFFNIAGYPEQTVPLPDAVVRAKELIDVHFAEPLDLAAMARAACVSPAHLIRLFRKHLEMTPVETLWQVRVENGQRLLIETGLSISEIAYRCGFNAPYHFARRFKDRYETTPKRFRLEEWSG